MAAKKGHIMERNIREEVRVCIALINDGEKEVHLPSRLSGNQIGAAGASTIAEALKVNRTLIHLFLDVNQIGDEGASLIGEAIKVNKTLRDLSLTSNEIGDAGAIVIAEALKVNKTLQSLGLLHNEIGDVGALAIAEALKVNKTFQSLGLFHNLITDVGIIAMAEALVGNTSLKSFFVFRDNEQPTDKSVPALRKMLQTSHITNMGDGDTIFSGSSISEEAREELKALLQIPVENRTIPIKKKKYSSFIARHPLDDGISDHVAINIKNALSSSGEVFVDGGRYQHLDISQLLNEMDQSQTVVLLLLKNDALKMPVCLIELNHAIVNGMSIVIVIDENEMNVEDIIEYVEHLETQMKEPALQLMKWCGVDIGEIGVNMRKMMMDAVRNNTIKRINTNKRRDLQSVIEEIAKCINEIGKSS